MGFKSLYNIFNSVPVLYSGDVIGHSCHAVMISEYFFLNQQIPYLLIKGFVNSITQLYARILSEYNLIIKLSLHCQNCESNPHTFIEKWKITNSSLCEILKNVSCGPGIKDSRNSVICDCWIE